MRKFILLVIFTSLLINPVLAEKMEERNIMFPSDKSFKVLIPMGNTTVEYSWEVVSPTDATNITFIILIDSDPTKKTNMIEKERIVGKINYSGSIFIEENKMVEFIWENNGNRTEYLNYFVKVGDDDPKLFYLPLIIVIAVCFLLFIVLMYCIPEIGTKSWDTF